MKRVLLSILATGIMQSAASQQYIVINGAAPILADDVEKITYESDEQFMSTMLDSRLEADAKTQLFSQALKLTGLADTLKAYWKDYQYDGPEKYYYKSHVRKEAAYYLKTRPRMFTVFAETDDVFAANGINNIQQLKAYAKQVYDVVYPEDANVSDPTNRRNSLNRFVAYHILKHGSTYAYLTAYDGDSPYGLQHDFNRNLADIASWYATLMPYASLKCSYPDAGEESGVYLNRRGLKAGPDKYGVQVRGAKVVGESIDDKTIYEHKAFNGYYYYIDQILTYNQQARDVVLGGERWRVNTRTLTPDVMNAYKREYYWSSTDSNQTDENINFYRDKNIILTWDAIENFSNTIQNPGLVFHYPNELYPSYENDNIEIFGDFDMSVKLPPMPAGEWEIRLGKSGMGNNPDVRIWLNGNLTIDSLATSDSYQESVERPYKVMNGPKDCGVKRDFEFGFIPFSEMNHTARFVLGRIQSNGKDDNYLRIKTRNDDQNVVKEFMFDYLELCPAAICDNQEIPEE